jgi:hypothetical protein
VVPQTPSPFEARQFDMGSEMDPFEARQFNLEQEAPAAAPPPPAMQPEARATGAVSDDPYAPDLVPDEHGLVTVTGDPYVEWLVSTYAGDSLYTGPRSVGDLRNLQIIAMTGGHPTPRFWVEHQRLTRIAEEERRIAEEQAHMIAAWVRPPGAPRRAPR